MIFSYILNDLNKDIDSRLSERRTLLTKNTIKSTYPQAVNIIDKHKTVDKGMLQTEFE